jgi:hypothetical protein
VTMPVWGVHHAYLWTIGAPGSLYGAMNAMATQIFMAGDWDRALL